MICPDCNQVVGLTACTHLRLVSIAATATMDLDLREQPRPCFVCGRAIESVVPDGMFQPRRGALCELHGNYGSTLFDNLRNAARDFYVCDDCLKERLETRTFDPHDYRWIRVASSGRGVAQCEERRTEQPDDAVCDCGHRDSLHRDLGNKCECGVEGCECIGFRP